MNANMPGGGSLSGNETRRRTIDLWLTYYREIDDDRLEPAYRALLSSDESHQQRRFYFRDDQRRHLVTRALVRTVLSRYLATDARALRFTTNRFGRPEVADLPREHCGLAFNISHTRGLIALAVAWHRKLGVDVENERAGEASLQVAQQVFATSELAELARLPLEARRSRFFEYWTLKESYVKARGMGLSIPLKQCSFHYPHERAVCIALEPQLGDDASRWCFWQYRPQAEYLLAVCAARQPAEESLVRVRRIIPLVSEETVDAQPFRTTVDHSFRCGKNAHCLYRTEDPARTSIRPHCSEN